MTTPAPPFWNYSSGKSASQQALANQIYSAPGTIIPSDRGLVATPQVAAPAPVQAQSVGVPQAAPKNGNTYGGSKAQALQGLIYQYGSVDQIPDTLIRSIGYSNKNDAKADVNSGAGTVKQYSGNTPNAQAAGAADNLLTNLGLNLTRGFVHDSMPGVAKTFGLPDATPYFAAPKGNGVAPSAGVVANKDDYAAQFGPGGSATTPVSGGSVPQENPMDPAPQATDPTNYLANIGNAPNYGDYFKGITAPNYVALPTPPAPTKFTINDFTPQAQQMASTAYSPAYAAIAEAESNAKANTANAQQEVTGIYQDLGKDITAQGNALDAKYAAAKTATQADTAAAQAAALAPAKAAAAQMAAAAGGSGGGGGAQYSANTMDDAAARAGALQQLGLSDTTAEQSHQLNYDTANAGLNTAAATAGAYGRQNLANTLVNTLSGLDQNKLNLTSNEALKVLDLAQSLSGQDLSLQQANAQQGNTYYNELLSAASAKNQTLSGTYAAQIQAAQNAYNAAYGAYNDNANRALSAQTEADTTDYRNRQLSQSEINAIISANGSNNGSTKLPNAGPTGVFETELGNALSTSGSPQDQAHVKAISDFITQKAQTYINQGTQPSMQTFLKDASAEMPPGMDFNTLYAAVSALYDSGMVTGWPGGKTL